MRYYPVALQLRGLYASRGDGKGSLPASERVSRDVLSFPMSPELGEAQQQEVARAVR